MKLKEGTLIKLRKKLEEQLKKVKGTHKIHIDKNILDDLLFYKVILDDKVIKIPIWSGEFLSKIDLSEISFDNVSFNMYILESLSKESKEKFIKKYKDLITDTGKINITYDFSNTNIKIDFSKIYEPILFNANFKNVDLSKSNGECLTSIISSNLSNSNIKIDFENIINCDDNDFSNNDFSMQTIDLEDRETDFLNNCNLSNTNIRINYKGNNIYQSESLDIYEEKLIERELLSSLMKKRYIDHCYVNNKFIKTKEEIEEQSKLNNNEYMQMLNKIEETIEEEIKRKL